MYKKANFNIYKENLGNIVFAESKKQEKIEQEKKDVTDQTDSETAAAILDGSA